MRGDIPDDGSPLFKQQMRQARIDLARDRATVLSELEEIALINEGDPATVGRQFDNAVRNSGLHGDPRMAGLTAVVATGDRDRITQALSDAAAELGLARIGGSPRRGPEQLVAYDSKIHQPDTGRPNPGRKVLIARPGYTATIDGETVPLSKAVVSAPTPAELEQISARQVRQAQRVSRIGSAAADLAEAAGNEASIAAARQSIDVAHAEALRMHGPRAVERVRFGQTYPAPEITEPLARMLAAAETATTSRDAADEAERIAREHGAELVGTVGEVVPFDPAVHRPVGSAPVAGTPVDIARPGVRDMETGDLIDRPLVHRL